METYIKISYLNDFVFCPMSIYFHQLYGNRSKRLYHDLPQIEGRAAHEAIDNMHYSTRKNILQGADIYSEKYKLCGKIDIFNVDSGVLTERKKSISRIYDGYVYQLYAQYFCLNEMGYEIKKLRFYSSDDNKVYPVKKPEEDESMFKSFESTLAAISEFDMESYTPNNVAKCSNCIYEPLCDRSLC